MTKRHETCTPDDDRPEFEIEITAKMISAGELALAWCGEACPERELVLAVYSAMAFAQRFPNLPDGDAASFGIGKFD